MLCFIIAYPEHQTHLKFHNVPFEKCAIQAHPRHSQTPQIHPARQTPHATTSKILQLTHSHHIITPHDPPFNLPNLYPLHLAHNSQHPQLKNTYPAPQQHPQTKHCQHLNNHASSHPTIYTSPSFCSTSFTSNLLRSLTSNCHLHLLLCPNFTPRFRPFYLTSTHKHTTIKPQSNHPKPPTFLSLREIFLRFRIVGFIPSSRLVSRKIWRKLQRI